jgi:hypothetical protein
MHACRACTYAVLVEARVASENATHTDGRHAVGAVLMVG